MAIMCRTNSYYWGSTYFFADLEIVACLNKLPKIFPFVHLKSCSSINENSNVHTYIHSDLVGTDYQKHELY